MSRRAVLAGGAALAAAAAAPAGAKEAGAAAATQEWTQAYGLSVFGDLALPADFKIFPYARADAPKGGTFSQDTEGAFNSLNPFILKGDAPGQVAMIFDTLMTGSLDEPDALYPLVAETVALSPDKNTMRFTLRKQARFHDGSPLTARDVVFSLQVLKDKASPAIRRLLADMESASAPDDLTVLVAMKAGHSRQLPLFIAGQPIFSAKYYAARAFDETTMEPPLGSGAYKIGKFEPGRFIAFDRVADYWGKDLPVNVGQNNFDVIRYEYFNDRTVAFEGFKAGFYTAREDRTSFIWAKEYNFPAFMQKRVVKETLPDARIPQTQGWFFNLRRPQFSDPRIREAISCCFDFGWTNANIMYGLYKHTQSFFENSDLKAQGAPDAAESALLEPFRAQLPAEIFGPAYLAPESDGSGQDRVLLKRALELFTAAGCKRDNGALLLPSGAPLTIEFLDHSSALERHTQPFIKNLKLLGVDARMRIVDTAQYSQRMRDFDFDMSVMAMLMAYSPGEELAAQFGSQAAAQKGSANRAGIAHPAIDALIAKAQLVNSRAELIPIIRALDRTLRIGRYWVPQWFKPERWLAHWDVYGRPERAPRFDPGMASTWWWDEARAKAIDYKAK
ncbi:MAG: ABC transporter substrate-binding protein [Hyphomicrobiales bacterium]|nr:ABC transporter substrate-binding protein [Hyphomicrobiales bacterium]